MLTLLILFLHIATMFTAVMVAFGSRTLMRLAYMTGQVAAVRGVGMAVARISPAIPFLFIAGGAFGLLTAINFGFDLLSPWLVIAYTLFAIAMLLGIVEDRPWVRRMGALLAETPDGPLTPEIRAMFAGTRAVVLTIISYAIFALIIFDMVVKPFS